MGQTIVQIGYRYTAANAPKPGTFWLYLKEPGLNGLKDFTVQNLNANAASNDILRQGQINNNCFRMFIADVDFQMGNGGTVYMTYVNQLAIERSKFVTTSNDASPLVLTNNVLMRFENNLVDYRRGRIAMELGERSTVSNNTIRLDNGQQRPDAETGGLELSFCRRMLVADNTITGYGGTRRGGGAYNDGEMLLTQNTVPDYYDVGRVGGATASTLSPSGKGWPSGSWLSSYNPVTQRTAIMITAGRGMGQWRWVTGHTPSALTVDSPWDVVPDGTSSYALTSISNFQQTYQRNRVENGRSGIEFYDGAIDSMVDANTLVNTGMIDLRSASQTMGFNGTSGVRQTPVWNCSVHNNSLTNSTGYMPAAISAFTISAWGVGLGTSLLNNDFRANSITGSFTRAPSGDSIVTYDGIAIQAINVVTANPNLGNIFSGNSVSGSLSPYDLQDAIGSTVNGVLSSQTATIR